MHTYLSIIIKISCYANLSRYLRIELNEILQCGRGESGTVRGMYRNKLVSSTIQKRRPGQTDTREVTATDSRTDIWSVNDNVVVTSRPWPQFTCTLFRRSLSWTFCAYWPLEYLLLLVNNNINKWLCGWVRNNSKIHQTATYPSTYISWH